MTRVLDLTRLSAIYATRLLAELGHEVIRVESPAGDDVRRMGPFLGGTPNMESGAYHQFFNAGKRSLALDVTNPDGQEVLARLIETADTMVANTPLPIDEARIRAINPRIVLTVVEGDDAPELCAYARGGLLSITGHPGSPPVLLGGHVLYAGTGLLVLVGTAAAMLVQQTAARGQTVKVDMRQCVEIFASGSVQAYADRGRSVERQGTGNDRRPLSGLYPSSNGYWMFSLNDSDRRWQALSAWIDDPVLSDEALATDAGRSAQKDMVLERVRAWASGLTKEELVSGAQSRHIPSAPVASTLDLAADPQLIDRGFLVEMDHPDYGRMWFPRGALATIWDRTVEPAPRLGEANADVLQELGYTAEERALLFERAVT